jgi:DTW domain-containing protein YfiP
MALVHPSSANAAPNLGRKTCYQCFRPERLCYCQDLPKVDNLTEIIVLQHPRERFHPIGTARIAQLGLRRVRVEVDVLGRFSAGREPLNLPPGTGVLYPRAPSRDLAELAPHERPRHLLVLDGTWHHAHTLLRDVSELRELPRFHFSPPRPSEYRIRREPRAECVSTIEAIAHSLALLEPETPGIEGLLQVFRGMIDRQVAARQSRKLGRVLRDRRPEAARALPRALVEEFERLVVVYGEAYAEQADAKEHRLVHWTACRPASGECFEALIKPRRPVDAHFLSCAQLTEQDLSQGLSEAEFCERWQNFLRPDSVLCGWTQKAVLPLFPLKGSVPGPCLSLKAAYHSLRRAPGPLELVVGSERLKPPEIGCLGRAGRRLANACALALFLRELALQGSDRAGEL